MIGKDQLAINRITAPALGLADFYRLASSLGFTKVEIRNDLGREDPIDGMKPAEARRLAADGGVEVITINALQKFNLPAARAKAFAELLNLPLHIGLTDRDVEDVIDREVPLPLVLKSKN